MREYYSDAYATIYHGDCREILPSLAPGLVVTDPPYGIALENHGRNDGKRRDRDWTIANDGDTEVGGWVVRHYLQAGTPIVAFASPRLPWPGKWRSLLVWHKPGLGMGGDPDVCWRMDWELVQVANNPPLDGGRDSGVLSYTMRPADFWAHPAQKPVSLMEYIVGKIPGEPVLDPFMGSGTTLVAAKNLGRKSIGIEIEERYCEIAAERLSQGVLDLGGAA